MGDWDGWALPPAWLLFAEVDHELLKSLNVIDLSLSQEALEELLLVEVLRAERKEILKNQQALQFGVLQLEGKLEATEVRQWLLWLGVGRPWRGR